MKIAVEAFYMPGRHCLTGNYVKKVFSKTLIDFEIMSVVWLKNHSV